jgi:signal transduction histidine kinase/CheY-like chemotaxis protein/HPt (histidine-containing phosphotransfer) domain-containing protein
MRTLAAWGAIATALVAGYALEVVALRVRQGTDLAAAASAMLLAAAVGALANRLRARRIPDTDRAHRHVAVPRAAEVGTLTRLGHELRGPLHAIMSHADALATDVTTETQRATLAAIRRNSDHLLEVVVRALGGSDGALPVQVACRPATLVADAITIVRRAAAQKGLVLAVECATPIPESMLADATALRQVLINLLDNAVKFTAHGRVILGVEFIETARTELRFAVRDTGPGIPPAELESIFEPHHRGTAGPGVPGTGLGLAIARELVHTMGGQLTAESRPGAGSTFTLTVPVHVDPTTSRDTIDLEPLATAGAGGRRLHGRVLVVEDASDVRELLARTLERAGAQVDAAGTGSEGLGRALAAARADRPFDLVLLDMQLPGLDGDEVVRRLRRAGCHAPIVALTAAAGADVRARCLAAGCTDYLAKPVGLDVLLAATEHHLSNGASDITPLTSSLPHGAGLDEVVAGFVGLLDGRLREIEQAADAGDTPAVERLAHRLRGAAGSHGFAPISDAALALEQTAATGGNLTPALLLLARLCRRATAAHQLANATRSIAEEREILPVALSLETLLRNES